MGKKLPHTPSSQIRSALRRLFLRSRERGQCMKNHGNACAKCGAKQSVAKGREVKVEVHHKGGVTNWQAMYESIREHLLCSPVEMQVLCKGCHDQLHKEEG